jgi:hypothetical protein
MAAGLRATLTKSQIDQDFGSDLATVRNALNRLKARYDSWWAPYGGAGYLALPGGAVQADADDLGTAITEAINLWNVMNGNALVASGGAVTVVAGTGHNFVTALNKVCGDSVT